MYVCVQIKICEGCGMLWFREQDIGGVYCSRCVRKLADFPSPGSRKLRGRKSNKTRMSEALPEASEVVMPVTVGCE
jgi:uncharacterized Zn finger protein (UPF0148 family)